MSLNTGYLKSIQGILKILEIIATCIAFACLVDFDRDVRLIGSKYEERYDFFLAVFVIGFVVCLLVFFVFLLSLEGQVTSEKNWNLLVGILICLGQIIIRLLVFSALFVLLFVVASSLVADYPLDNLYDARWHKTRGLKKYANLLTVSVFFGFVSAALLLVDAFLAFKKVKG